jgi:sec-independent protein translocase protein TatA
MFGIGTQELLLILVVVLLLFGGKRVPEVARSLGKGMADFRKAMHEVQREVDLEMLKTPEPDRRAAPPAPTGSPAAAAGAGSPTKVAEPGGAQASSPGPAPAKHPGAPPATGRAAGLEAPRGGDGDENRRR